MTRLTTQELAAYGAFTGTAAIALTMVGRRDVAWARRSKVTPQARTSLVQLRDAATAARVSGASALRTPRVRGDLEIIGELTTRAADRHLRKLLRATQEKCAVAASGGTGTFAESTAIDRALDAICAALDRVDKIDRKAPK